jgi:hypothetical protein
MGPPPRFGHAMAHHGAGRVVLLGGANESQVFGDSCAREGAAWVQIDEFAGRQGHRMARHPRVRGAALPKASLPRQAQVCLQHSFALSIAKRSLSSASAGAHSGELL